MHRKPKGGKPEVPFEPPALRSYGPLSQLTRTSISSQGNTNEPVGNDSGDLQGRKKT